MAWQLSRAGLILITVEYIISAAVSANCAIVTGFGIIKPLQVMRCVTKRGEKNKRCECMRYRGGIRVKRKGEGVVTLEAVCILHIDSGKLSEPSSFLCRMEIRWLSLSLSHSLYTDTGWPDGQRASGRNCWFVWTAWNRLKAENLCMCASEPVCLYAW